MASKTQHGPSSCSADTGTLSLGTAGMIQTYNSAQMPLNSPPSPGTDLNIERETTLM